MSEAKGVASRAQASKAVALGDDLQQRAPRHARDPPARPVAYRDMHRAPTKPWEARASNTMVLEDCDDDFDDFCAEDVASSHPAGESKDSMEGRAVTSARRLAYDEAVGIQRLLFGERRCIFSDAWKKQGFFFSRDQDLGYGLVQTSGGPCGVLAAVNAFILSNLLHSADTLDGGPGGWMNPSPDTRERCLVRALSLIIWRAATGGLDPPGITLRHPPRSSQGASHPTDHVAHTSPFKICIHTGSPHLSRSSGYQPDGITERLQVLEGPPTSSFDDLCATVSCHLRAFTAPQGFGALLLLCSAILSRSLASVRRDMDEGFAGEVRSLMDAHTYLSQEGVNLLIVGQAKSNVFDGNRSLADDVQGSKDAVSLGGIPRRGLVGFLTLHEAYKYLEVGDHLKSPRTAVWVVYSESHYSVLFSADSAAIDEDDWRGQDVNVYYWDMLGKQDEVIRMTARPNSDRQAIPDIDDERALIPPLDLVVRTKWAGRLVDWNGSEPIL